jgi:SAM-dependent methyltransferase
MAGDVAGPGQAFDRQLLTEVGHGDLPYWNPVTPSAVAAMLDGLALTPAARVLDVGCGRGGILLEALRRSGASGVGVDSNRRAITFARAAARDLPAGRPVFHAEPFAAAAFPPRSFDAVVCVGSLHAAGGLDAALPAFDALLATKGRMLIGEGYWKRQPDPAYLAHIGASADEMSSHQGNLAAMRAAGFSAVATRMTTPAEWEAYETGYRDRVLDWTAARPGDNAAQAMRAHVLHWHDGYQRWGHDTMGFALYLLQRM